MPASARSLTVALPLALTVVPACKGGRSKLEQLVPDGATGMVSADIKATMQSPLYKDGIAFAREANPQIGETIDKLDSDCDLQLDNMEAYVLGFDALSQGFMGAMRWKNLGKTSTLECVGKLMADGGGSAAFELSEEDGKTKLEFAGGEAVGWAADDDTVVFTTKGWAGAVSGRIKGEGKSAVDNYLKDAIALTDTSAHVWLAAEMPPIAKPFLEKTPAKGLERGGMSMKIDGDDMDVALTVQFAEEGQANDVKAAAQVMLGDAKPMAERAGVPTDVLDSIELSTDGNKALAKAKLPMKKIMEETTTAFQTYISRSKTSEARVNVAKMFDGAAAFFNEEHIERSTEVLGAGGTIVATHKCPSMPGVDKGNSGVVPPLSVDCSKGPGGHCVPKPGGGDGPGEYDSKLWTDNDVFNGLNFQVDGPHVFHYQFSYENLPSDFGACQFTAQAFGDLDGDGTFSTYERSGAADENGVNAAAGLYIDQEVE